jgi:hypothetical protein
MFFFRHPKPVVDGRAVAVQVVQQKATQEVSRTVLIVERRNVAPTVPLNVLADGKQDLSQAAQPRRPTPLPEE